MYTVHCTVELIVIVYFFGTEGHGVRPFMDHISFLPQPYGLQYMYSVYVITVSKVIIR